MSHCGVGLLHGANLGLRGWCSARLELPKRRVMCKEQDEAPGSLEVLIQRAGVRRRLGLQVVVEIVECGGATCGDRAADRQHEQGHTEHCCDKTREPTAEHGHPTHGAPG